MTLVGKIFTVAIFIMSIVYMGFAMAVYATHKNWREVVERPQATANAPKGLKHQVADKEQEIDELKLRYSKLMAELTAVRNAEQQQRGKLETEYQTVLGERDRMREELNRLAEANRELTASVDSTQKNLTRLTTEVEGLREEIRDAQLDRDTYFTQVVAKTDDLHVAHGTLTRLKEREGQLVERIAHYKNKMAEIGIKNPDAPLTGAAPTIAGQVLAVRGDNLIEVSIGADDGLREGHTVEVFRASSYLGRAEIVRTSPDRAVAKVMPETRRGVIQKGDRVATRLKS